MAAAMKKVPLLFLVLGMAIATVAPATCNSSNGEPALMEEPDHGVMIKPTRSRFLLQNSRGGGQDRDGDGDGRGRRQVNLCGRSGRAPNYQCKQWFPLYKNATCCATGGGSNILVCFDVGGFLNDRCGSCNNRCAWGLNCCSGKCVNLRKSDRNNCGWCGHKCPRNLPCRNGLCGYGGRDGDK